MIDMGAVLGGRATVGKNCHVGAGAVLAGVVEPASATPVIIEDDVLIGANAVVIEGVRVGKGAVIAARGRRGKRCRAGRRDGWCPRPEKSKQRTRRPPGRPRWSTPCGPCNAPVPPLLFAHIIERNHALVKQ